MKVRLIDKINNEINSELNKECQVVYIMTGLRKLLDGMRESGSDKYGVVRFYCDWMLHTSKDRITSDIKRTMDNIDNEIPMDYRENVNWWIQQKEATKFIYMESLREEFNKLFQKQGISVDLLGEEKWIKFVSLLVKILEEQPIKNPNQNIDSFSFEPSAEGAVIWVIKFSDSRGITKFGNKY